MGRTRHHQSVHNGVTGCRSSQRYVASGFHAPLARKRLDRDWPDVHYGCPSTFSPIWDCARACCQRPKLGPVRQYGAHFANSVRKRRHRRSLSWLRASRPLPHARSPVGPVTKSYARKRQRMASWPKPRLKRTETQWAFRLANKKKLNNESIVGNVSSGTNSLI